MLRRVHKESVIRCKIGTRLENSEEVATGYLEEENSRQREELQQSPKIRTH